MAQLVFASSSPENIIISECIYEFQITRKIAKTSLNRCLYEEGKKTCSPHVTISFPVENTIWACDYELILSILKAMRTRISTNVILRLKWHDTKSYSRDNFYSTLLFAIIDPRFSATDCDEKGRCNITVNSFLYWWNILS